MDGTHSSSQGVGVNYALVIGVEAHQGGHWPAARFAAADAAAFADALGLAPDRQIRLLDGFATKATIESKLRRLGVHLGSDDTLAVFVAGHVFAAGGANFLIAHDTQPDDPLATAVPLRVIADAVSKAPCRHAVLFLDPRTLSQPRPDGASDLDETELADLFGDSRRAIALVSREASEDSYASEVWKHSAWTHLVLESLAGNAPAALDGDRVTPRSLQRYLADELPRILRSVLERPVAQTPAFYGRPLAGWALADLGPVLRARREVAGLAGQQLERVVLWSQARGRVKELAGFQKTHHVPDRVRPATTRFTAAIARGDIQADLEAVYSAVREHLGYKRKDILLTPPTEGSGALRTPEFDYLVSVALAVDDPAAVVWRREVTNLRTLDVLRRATFQAAFGNAFQALSLEYATPLEVERLIDRLEDEKPVGVRFRSAADGSWCDVDLAGFPGTVRVEGIRLDIVGRRIGAANTLWAAFEAFQLLCNQQSIPRSLPARGK
jgi:hypothetical protein